MDLKNTLTSTRLLEAAGGAILVLWGIYKKELQDYFKASCKELYVRLFPPPVALTLTKQQLGLIVDNGHAGLEMFLYLLLREYAADRAARL